MSVLAASAVDALVSDLASEHPDIEVRPSSAATVEYLDDAATRLAPRRSRTPFGPTVALPTTTEQVQQLVRKAARRGVAVVPRGAGSGLSGGASATADQLVISTERLTRIIEVSPLDEVAVVEPGVLNAELNAHLAAASACSTRPTRQAGRSRRSAATSPRTRADCGARSTASPGSRCWPSMSSSPTAV